MLFSGSANTFWELDVDDNSDKQLIWVIDLLRKAGFPSQVEVLENVKLVVDSHAHMQELLHLEQDENMRLRDLLNTPHTQDWIEGVRLEAAHQVNRWGADHDDGKEPADWFWLIGYLAGKALAAAISGNVEKAKHHTISGGAALLNWFHAINGDSTIMRPGIAKPEKSEK
jgi:hypothetical protein